MEGAAAGRGSREMAEHRPRGRGRGVPAGGVVQLIPTINPNTESTVNGHDDEVVEVQTTRAMTPAPPPATNTGLVQFEGAAGALANLTDDQFEERLRVTQIVRDRVRRIKESLLKPGVHYGMPGAKTKEEIEKAAADGKVGLYKAGAEQIAEFFGLVVGEPNILIDRGDPENRTSPTFEMHARVPIHRGDTSGPVVAVGIGAWSTWEIKNRYRNEKKKCPQCSRVGLVLQKEARYGQFKGLPTAWCPQRDGGCNGEWLQSDPLIAKQPVGKVPNVDAADLLNTGVKMAKKRGFVDGIISAAALSDVFTQDIEDMSPEQRAEYVRKTDEVAESVVNEMYGPPAGDPDGWRREVEGAPATAAAGSRLPTNGQSPAPAVAGTPGPDYVTEAQVRALQACLRRKFGAVTRAEMENALHERCGVPGQTELLTLLKADASRLIAQLNALPDDLHAADRTAK